VDWLVKANVSERRAVSVFRAEDASPSPKPRKHHYFPRGFHIKILYAVYVNDALNVPSHRMLSLVVGFLNRKE
jgi:hypothetical protein